MTLSDEFLSKGVVKIPVENMENLESIKCLIEPCEGILSKDLNAIRLAKIDKIRNQQSFNKCYFSLAQLALEELAGNELVMQRNVNLSIQLPNDDSSLLPIHCDTWSGDSPYEVVLWVPLVDCYDTKSMFFVNAHIDALIQPKINQYKTSEELWNVVEKHATFIDVKYGECLIFTQNIMHGNRINLTNETRWSMNCRFKSALTPYADKKLGEFFEPITIRPATRLGARYEFPRL